MDSFLFISIFVSKLLAENIYCMGTLRSNRHNFPPDLKDSGLACRGDRIVRQDGNVNVCVWQDTRPVTFMSSGHNPDHTKSIRRKKGDGSIIDFECPVCIVDYNQYMGGVDRGDQYRQYYRGHVKSRKSYKYFFRFVFDVCVLNA